MVRSPKILCFVLVAVCLLVAIGLSADEVSKPSISKNDQIKNQGDVPEKPSATCSIKMRQLERRIVELEQRTKSLELQLSKSRSKNKKLKIPSIFHGQKARDDAVKRRTAKLEVYNSRLEQERSDDEWANEYELSMTEIN